MHRLIKSTLVLILISPAMTASVSPDSPRMFDEFGDINCEDEYARLDNFAVTLQKEPATKGVIIFYGGQRFRGRLPKRGEAATRASRLKPYLVERRGISADRILVIDGGYAKDWHVELWIIPVEANPPQPRPTVPIEKMRFRKGTAHPRDFRCQI